MKGWLRCVVMVMAIVVVGAGARSAQAGGEHPYILWTKEEAAALRKRIETEPWAKRVYEAHSQGDRRGNRDTFANLLRYSVMGDEQAGEIEKRKLLSNKGDPVGLAIQYDVLYDILSPAERERVEKRFRDRVRSMMNHMKDQSWMNRHNILPNLTYFWVWDTQMLAVALRDRKLAREVFESPYCMKWYLDEYLSDSGFYNEEFGKMFVRSGSMLLWSRACDRLGIPEIGWDYVGRQGATWKGHVESVIRVGYPRVDLGTERYHYPRMTMGDAKGARGLPGYGFQHSLAPGALTDGPVDRRGFYSGNHLPQWMWFEVAHEKYPEAGFGYFLAQMREPDETHYYPTLYFGLDPIDAREAKPPSAPSAVYPGRGIAMLRAEEGRGYWEGPWPAVGMRLATPYAHHVQDCFSLTGFYAYNRPLFINRQHSTNYSGVDPGWSNSSRSHSTVVVDFTEPKTIGEVPVRQDMNEHVKFVAARGKGIFEGVDQTRALMLTREYLFDVFHLASDRPRHYQWIIQSLGHVTPDEPTRWAASRDLVGSLFDLSHERSLATDGRWSVTTVQSTGGAHPEFSGLGERWFEQRIGVRTTVVGEEGTTAYVAWSPVVKDTSGRWHGRNRFAFGEEEPAGATIVAVRKKPRTSFVAVHEPFKGAYRIEDVSLIERTSDVVAVQVSGAGANGDGGKGAWTDYLLLRLGDEAGQPVTVRGQGVAVTFAGHGYIRVDGEGVHVEGDVRSFRLPVSRGDLPVSVRGERLVEAKLVRSAGAVAYGDAAAGDMGPREDATAALGTVGVRWEPQWALSVPEGGTGEAKVAVWNSGSRTLKGVVHCEAEGGVAVQPAKFELSLQPGEERAVRIGIDVSQARRNELHRVVLKAEEGGAFEVDPKPLLVTAGVAHHRDQVWPADFEETIFSPRYIAKYYYMESGGAMLLLDPEGLRRSGSGGASYPQIVQHGKDDRGREGWHARNVPKFPYFVPVVVRNEPKQPAVIYEAGRHAHGSTSAVEHWFTQDWIVVRYRNAKDGERLAFDWDPSSRKNELEDSIPGRREQLAKQRAPGKVLVMTSDGRVYEGGEPEDRRNRFKLPREASSEIAATFVRPHGYGYGWVCLYPKGSSLERDRVVQPAEAPMGFTFCREEEVAALVAKWRAAPPSGQATDRERSTYNGAFMPHLERAE